MTIRNLSWLRRRLAKLLNMDIDEPDQDFVGSDADNPWEEIDEALSEAYEEEVELAIEEGCEERFAQSTTIIWPSADRTLVLPNWMAEARLLRIDDETHATPGEMLWVVPRTIGSEPEVSFLDRRTLQWGTAGPGETKTLRVFYIGEAAALAHPIDEPVLIPNRFRRLLIWSAGVILRGVVDEDEVPSYWISRRDELRAEFWTSLFKGSPRDPNRGGILPDAEGV